MSGDFLPKLEGGGEPPGEGGLGVVLRMCVCAILWVWGGGWGRKCGGGGTRFLKGGGEGRVTAVEIWPTWEGLARHGGALGICGRWSDFLSIDRHGDRREPTTSIVVLR